VFEGGGGRGFSIAPGGLAAGVSTPFPRGTAVRHRSLGI